VEGRDYHFVSQAEFDAARERGEFAEAAEVHGHLYGTLRQEVDGLLAAGRHVVMDIDIQGTRQFAAAYPDSVLVFILPPDARVMLDRLRARGTESPDSLARRLRSAVAELKAVQLYGYVVVNADLGKAVEAVSGIIDAEAARRPRVDGLDEKVGAMVADLEAELEKMNRRR